MIIRGTNGRDYQTQMLSETDDIFHSQSALTRMEQLAAEQYFDTQHKAFAQDFDAQEKLERIGLSDYGAIEDFKLAFGDRTFQKHSPGRDTDEGAALRGALKRLGIIRDTGHGVFNGAVLFPLYYDIYYRLVGIYGYWLRPRKGFEPEFFTVWCEEGLGVFNHHVLNSHKDIIICQSPVTACQLIERGLDNAVAIMGNNDSYMHYVELFRHLTTQSVKVLPDGSRYGQYWSGEITEAMRLLNIKCSLYCDA